MWFGYAKIGAISVEEESYRGSIEAKDDFPYIVLCLADGQPGRRHQHHDGKRHPAAAVG